MRVVLESIDGRQSALIPDDLSERMIIDSDLLPIGAVVGDVIEVERKSNGQLSLKRLTDETEKRKHRIKSKREKLLKRKH